MDHLLGKQAKDKITGFSGIITGKIEYLYGCNQYGLSPLSVDGKRAETEWFDEGRIEVTGQGIHPKEVKAVSGKNGADKPPTVIRPITDGRRRQ